MTPLKRRVAAISAPVLLALSLTACGGDDGGGDSDAPESATNDEFCEAFLDVGNLETGADIKDFAANLEEVGTPEDVSEDERAGFEVFIDAAQDVDDDATLEDIEDPDVSEEDNANAEAFVTYATETCAGSLPDELPTDAPTE